MKAVGLFLWRIIVDKVIIFGCGSTGLRTYNQIKNCSEVIAFLDNDEERTGSTIEGIPVYEPQSELIKQLDCDYIVIASVYGTWQIKEQLYKMGVTDEKIRMYMKTPDVLTPFLKNLAEDFKEEHISGACAEVGVFRGETAQKINRFFPDRKLHLYDTFEGFSEKDIEVEYSVGSKQAKAGQFSDTSLQIVMENMEAPENVIIHKGYFPDTAAGLNERFCFVRIDLDLYAPTKSALEIFEPLMYKGGIILVHDYFGNQYPGIKKIVKEFMVKHSKLSKIPIGDTMSIAIMGF